MGTLSTTVAGKQCQRWTSNTPHMPDSLYTDDTFPDGSRKAAKNYCRNPVGSTIYTVWCYTMDPDERLDTCMVPRCSKSAAKCVRCS